MLSRRAEPCPARTRIPSPLRVLQPGGARRENRPGTLLLHERDDVELISLPVSSDRHLYVRRCDAIARCLADRAQVADDRRVHERAAAVFTPFDLITQPVFGDRHDDVGAVAAAGLRQLARVHLYPNPFRVARADRFEADAQHAVRRSGGTVDRAPGGRRITADELRLAVDDHLGRVDALGSEAALVVTLPAGQGRG